jgi:hypothetical protein
LNRTAVATWIESFGGTECFQTKILASSATNLSRAEVPVPLLVLRFLEQLEAPAARPRTRQR